jgi:hypothetical protein
MDNIFDTAHVSGCGDLELAASTEMIMHLATADFSG